MIFTQNRRSKSTPLQVAVPFSAGHRPPAAWRNTELGSSVTAFIGGAHRKEWLRRNHLLAVTASGEGEHWRAPGEDAALRPRAV